LHLLSKSANAYIYTDTLEPKKSPGCGYTSKVHIREKYHIVGFISSGTYGRVYKAVGRNGQKGDFAIKKFVFNAPLSVKTDARRFKPDT